MSDLFRAILLNDDVNVVFEALSEWCRLTKTNPNSVKGCSMASRLFDLFQAGCGTKDDLLAALAREAAMETVRRRPVVSGPPAPAETLKVTYADFMSAMEKVEPWFRRIDGGRS